MPKKKTDEIIETTEADNSKQLSVVELTIKREHCITPHSIELRKNADGYFAEARTEDWKHAVTLGAKTVADIFAENGAGVPDDEETEMLVTFSPHNGEIIAILEKPVEVTV